MNSPDLPQLAQQHGDSLFILLCVFADKFLGWARSLRSQGARVGLCEDDLAFLAGKLDVELPSARKRRDAK